MTLSLNSTSQGGKGRHSLILDNVIVEELAAAVAASLNTKEKFVANFGGSNTSTKVRSTTTTKSAKMGDRGIMDSILVTAMPAATEEGASAAVASKLAFEKFLLRLETASLYNMWLTVDQVRIADVEALLLFFSFLY